MSVEAKDEPQSTASYQWMCNRWKYRYTFLQSGPRKESNSSKALRDVSEKNDYDYGITDTDVGDVHFGRWELVAVD